MSSQTFYDDELTEEKDYLFKIPILSVPVKTWQFIVFLVVCTWILILGLGAAIIWWAVMLPGFPVYGVVGNLNGDTSSINKHFTVYTTVINTVNNQTTEPDGFIAAEHSFGFAINHRDIDGPRRVQESPRITAMMKRTNGTFYGDTALNIKLTCGSNATTYGSEVSKWNITCDTPAITANSSGLVVEGDLVVTGGINMPNSRIQFQGEDVLTHGLDPTTGLNVLQLGVGNKRTHYRATQHDFVGAVNASSSVISTAYFINTNKVVSLLNGQVQLGNDTTGSTFPSDFRGTTGQVLVTNGAGVTSWANEGGTIRKSSGSVHTRTNVGSDTTTEVGVVVLESSATTKTWCRVAFFGVTPTITAKFEFRDSANTLVATTTATAITAGFGTQDCTSFPAAGVGSVLRVDMVTTGFSAGTVRAEGFEIKYVA
jgi:hypothetical protein